MTPMPTWGGSELPTTPAPGHLGHCIHVHIPTHRHWTHVKKNKEIKVPVRVVTSGSYSLDRNDDGVQLLGHSGAQIIVVADF